MKVPKQKHVCPRGGWSLKFPSGWSVSESHYAAFLQACREHMERNDMPYPFNTSGGWQDRMWDQVCQQNPHIECEDTDKPERIIDGNDVLRYLRTMWSSFEKGALAVNDEEQNRRLSICLTCPRMGYISCFIGCNSIAHVLSEFIIGRKINRREETNNKSCLACGCSIEVKTMWPLDVIKDVDAKMGITPDYAPNCWIREGESPPVPAVDQLVVDVGTEHAEQVQV